MALPLTRSLNAVDNGPLPASVVNEIQDEIIAHGHGEISRYASLDGSRFNNVLAEPLNQAWWDMTAAGVAKARFIIPFRPGDRILEWRVYVRDANPGGPNDDRVFVTLYEYDPLAGATRVQIGSQQISDGLGGDQALGEDLRGAPHVVAADKFYELDFRALDLNGNIVRIYPACLLFWDHP